MVTDKIADIKKNHPKIGLCAICVVVLLIVLWYMNKTGKLPGGKKEGTTGKKKKKSRADKKLEELDDDGDDAGKVDDLIESIQSRQINRYVPQNILPSMFY